MAESQPFRATSVYDAINVLAGGMHSGVAPLLLEKTQASYLSNTTVRDGYATCRPPFSKTHLTFVWPSPLVQTEVEEGLFQGAIPTAYRPDSGPPSQIASISGKLYQFIINGDVVTVRDISIPGDPNPATATQAWIWQAENFVIVQDGISLPIFFDGNTSRRSYGPTQVLATQDAGPVAKPTVIGNQVTLTLTAPYTGPYNIPVLIDGEYYQPIANAAGYLVDATNITDTPGAPIAVGDQVIIRGDVFTVVQTTFPIGNAPGTYPAGALTFSLATTLPFAGAIGDTAIILGKVFRATLFNSAFVQVTNTETVTVVGTDSIPAGTIIIKAGATTPNVVVGSIATGSATVAPAQGAVVQLTLDTAYGGADDQSVFINNKQYTISTVPPPPGGTSLVIVNLSNVTAGNFANAVINSVPELPAGRMGAYGHAQNWMALVDGISFIFSDISGSPSGTQAYQYRDAVLKTTGITFGAGNFRIPSAGDVITSMTFAATLDMSMGQGPLMIGTERTIFSCTAPVDASNLAAIVLKGTPILTTALIGRGPLAQNSTINVNSDIQFRSTVGLGSLLIARQQFTQSISGNTPISEEMIRVFKKDNQQLLPYGSAINFDNRVLFTASPQASSQGVFHTSLVAMNLDGLSSLRGKEPACYDGQWTGLNTLQLTTGLFNGVSRAFAYTFNVSLSKIELYELLPTGDLHFDNGSVPITWGIETAAMFNQDVKPSDVLVQLMGGDFAVDEVVGTVRFELFYKPDQYGAYGAESCWVSWHQFSICAADGSKPLYFPRLGLPEPKATDCVGAIDTPARNFYTVQVRLVITGMCRLLRLRLGATTQPIPKFAKVICDEVETVVVS